MGIRLLFFFRDLFGDFWFCFAICVGFGDLFFPRFVCGFGDRFFFRDLLRDLGICFFFAICLGIWGFVFALRDLFGDFGDLFFFS